jgi:hypothetical protein
MQYTQVDPSSINEMIKDGTLQKMTVVKDIPVKAVELTQEVVDKMLADGGYKTVVIDDEGKPFVETTNKKINVGDFLVTNQIAGYDNSYVVPAAKFSKLYTSTDNKEIFNPVGEDRTVYMLPEGKNVVFEAPWGGDMKIRAGGVLVADGDKFYGINPEEFKATHSVKEPKVQNNVTAVLESVRGNETENTNRPKIA